MERLDSAPARPPVAGGGGTAGSTEDHPYRAAPFVAALMGGAAIIHFAMAPAHAADSTFEAVAFAAAGWAQAILAVLLVMKPRKEVFGATAALNLVFIGVWAWSRTSGLPIGAHPGVAEGVGTVDLAAVLMQGAAVLGAIGHLVLPADDDRKLPLAVPAIGALAVLGLATAAVASPEAASHGHDESAGGHVHGTEDVAAMEAQLAAVQDTRCDLGFNPVSYYDETNTIGIDTVSSPTMDAHDHGTITAGVAPSDPFEGRGSEKLDEIVGNLSTDSEATAGMMVAKLGNFTEEEYQAFIYQMWKNNQSSGGHDAHSSSGDDTHGHGGHFGPQPWIAMTDADECATLQSELDEARDVAMAYPTPKEAKAAGYHMVTTYVPGIASHWMNFGYVDGTFELDKPEMLLYDGTGDDASVVGLSYFIVHESDAEPTQGFTGQNDHYHRHIGLCIRGGVVVGDTTLSEEECAQIGGVKQTGGAGWMSHAWVVPGCESPWGVFSGANPMLDSALGKSSGTDGGGCAGAGVNDRYDLSPGSRSNVLPAPAESTS